jgi:alkylation response protein AidB-like acyl-CoA dehydrogenase
MRRTIFTEDHDAFRSMLREFIAKEISPHFHDWYAAGEFPREVYRRLGDLGLFSIGVPEEFGGAGITSFTYSAVQAEEVARAAVSFGAAGAHVVLGLPYLLELGTQEQKQRWLPGFMTGETMFALAMTEPGAGSDLAGMRSTATLSEDGTHYLLNGAKTFITGGVHADRVIVCARTSPPRQADRRFGISLLVVDTTSPGYSVGRKLDKIGIKLSDTAELFFDNVRVPVSDLLGEQDQGFSYLGHNLPLERLSIAYDAYAQAAAAIEFTKAYTRDRQAFGQPVAGFQNTKFELAACHADVAAAEALVDRAVAQYDAGALSAADAATAKLFCTEVASRVIDRCLQLHGGYGYINEYPVARLYADNRVNRIYGGTSEVMKTIIAKSMGL